MFGIEGLCNYQRWLTSLDFDGSEDTIQRVPALRAFWALETVLHEILLVGLYCGPLLMLNPPLART